MGSFFYFVKMKKQILFMIFSTLEHILTHISFSVISIVITIHLITLLVCLSIFQTLTMILVYEKFIRENDVRIAQKYEEVEFSLDKKKNKKKGKNVENKYLKKN